MKKLSLLTILTIFIILFSILVSSFGLFYTTNGSSYEFINQYGDMVKIYGDGLYKFDSLFAAPIFRGTDFVILFVAVPLLIIALYLNIKRNSLKTKLFLTSTISVFAYYATSIAFGVTYNFLHLVYIALFGLSIFALVISFISIEKNELSQKINPKMKTRGIYIFLSLSGLALIVAWLPDIITSLINKRSLTLIEVYTTQITYVIDMGLVGPVALSTIFLIKKKKAVGFILLSMILALCIIVGVMMPFQSLFQFNAGVDLPLPVLLTKSATFVILAIFAIYFKIKLFRNLEKDKNYPLN